MGYMGLTIGHMSNIPRMVKTVDQLQKEAGCFPPITPRPWAPLGAVAGSWSGALADLATPPIGLA
jgi:hypothetical protein